MTEYNAGNPKQVKQRQDKEKLRQDQRLAELQALLKQPEFRRFVWLFIHENCGLMQSPWNPNGSTQTLMIGRQDVGRELWGMIEKANPEVIPKMMIEYVEWRRE